MAEIPSGPDFDLSLLNEIADGSDEFMVDSIDMFLQQTPESLQQMGDAITAQDWPTAASAAHKLKSTLGFFGMLLSQALSQQIEIACKEESPNAVEITEKHDQLKYNMSENTDKLTKLKAELAV